MISEVRKNIYSQSIGSWRKYSEQLQPLIQEFKKYLPALKKKGALVYYDKMNWNCDEHFNYDLTSKNDKIDKNQLNNKGDDDTSRNSRGQRKGKRRNIKEVEEEDEDEDEEGLISPTKRIEVTVRGEDMGTVEGNNENSKRRRRSNRDTEGNTEDRTNKRTRQRNNQINDEGELRNGGKEYRNVYNMELRDAFEEVVEVEDEDENETAYVENEVRRNRRNSRSGRRVRNGNSRTRGRRRRRSKDNGEGEGEGEESGKSGNNADSEAMKNIKKRRRKKQTRVRTQEMYDNADAENLNDEDEVEEEEKEEYDDYKLDHEKRNDDQMEELYDEEKEKYPPSETISNKKKGEEKKGKEKEKEEVGKDDIDEDLFILYSKYSFRERNEKSQYMMTTRNLAQVETADDGEGIHLLALKGVNKDNLEDIINRMTLPWEQKSVDHRVDYLIAMAHLFLHLGEKGTCISILRDVLALYRKVGLLDLPNGSTSSSSSSSRSSLTFRSVSNSIAGQHRWAPDVRVVSSSPSPLSRTFAGKHIVYVCV